MKPEASGRVSRRVATLLASVLAGAWLACVEGSTPAGPDSRTGTLLIVSGDNQTGEVGSLLPEPLVLRLNDSLGRPLSRALIAISGDVERAQVMSDAAGRAVFRWRLLSVAGVQHVIARADLRSHPAVAVRATALAGPISQLVLVSGASLLGFVGSDVDTVVVRAIDRFGNTVVAAAIDWSVTKGGGSLRALGPDRSSAQRAIWTLGPEAGENLLAVSASGVRQAVAATAFSGAFSPRLVTAGGGHTCALSAASVAYCWGDNSLGQIGSPANREPVKSAVKVPTDALFLSLVAGGLHTCGLTSTGEAYCWGFNSSGETGSSGHSNRPTRITGVPPLTAVAAGSHHTCGLTSAGSVWCWGDNSFGQIGDGSVRSTAAAPGSYTTPPVSIVGDRRYVALAAAFGTTCAISTTGDTYCWGSNADKELGRETAMSCRIAGDPYFDPIDRDVPCSSTPLRLDIPAKLTSLTAYATDWCGISTTGELWCWGAGLTSPQIGAPVRFAKAWVVGHIICGVENAAGAVSCWGPWWRPGIAAEPPFGANLVLVDLSSAGGHACGISHDARREAFCWGGNYQGQIGDGTTLYRPLPGRVLPPGTR